MEWVISSEIDDSILGSDHVPIFLSIDLNKLW
jgi:exonuclease III